MVGTGGFAYSFQLTDVTDYASLVLTFQQYRLERVEINLIPQGNNLGINSGSVVPITTMAVCLTDANIPLSSASLQEFGGVQVFPWTKLQYMSKFSFKPRPSTQVSDPGVIVNTGYATAIGNPWIDSNYPTVPYYGLKFWTDNAGFSDQLYIYVRFTYSMRSFG